MLADCEKDFEDAVRMLHSDFAKFPKPVKYVMSQWIDPYKERFMKAWTNQVMHYGNTTTNRVESHHSALKRMLRNSSGKFQTCWVQCHSLFEACHTAIKASFSKSVNIAKQKFTSNLYSNLYGVVSHVALEKPFDEIKKPVVRDDVNIDIDNCFEDAVSDMSQVYKSYDQEKRLLFLRKMRELAHPGTTNIIEPKPWINTRGRPKTSKKGYDPSSKKCDPSLFEYQESMVGSCSVDEEVMMYDVSKTLPSPMFSKKGKLQKQPIFRKRTRSTQSTSFIQAMPVQFQPYIVNVKNVMGDGHCGFRTVALLMGFSEDDWPRVRQDLMNELGHNIPLYEDVFRMKERVQEVLETLNCFTETAGLDNWFLLPYMGYLVAAAYNVALIVLDPRLSLTFLPLMKAVPEQPRSICMALVNDNHFVHVSLGVGHPLTPVDTSWLTYHRAIANGWLTAYEVGQII
ncbi:hypothetical protein ACS0TY_030864 [Phlomoides rotata]